MTSTTDTIQGKWGQHGDEFVGEVRLSAAAREAGVASLVGRTVALYSKAKKMTLVTICDVVQDYGPGDVTVYRVTR